MMAGKRSRHGSYLVLVDASGRVTRLEGDPLLKMRERIANCDA